MGRVSSRYNYRIAKTKKEDSKETVKKILPPDKIVIKNRKSKAKPKVQVKKSTASISKINKTKNNKVSPIVKKAVNRSPIKQTVTLERLKDYCNGKKIILVGNAKDIVRAPYGKQIDSYDIVVRMNHGHPLPKYVANMGKKYDIWSHGFLSHKKQVEEYNRIKKGIKFHIETNERKLCRRIFDNKAFLIPEKWYKLEYDKNHKGKEMSTGLNAATFFINWIGTMSEITIVGFDFLKTSNAILKSASARKFHDTDAEEEIMVSMLLESGKYIPFNKKYDFAK